MSNATIKSAIVQGIDALAIDVEVAIAKGIPGTYIIGMVDAAVDESKARIRCAIQSAGFTYPNERIVVNLAPSSIRKSGSAFDLAIAVGILVASGQVDPKLARGLFFGEVGLDATVRQVRGIVSVAELARERKERLVVSAQTEVVSSGDWDGDGLFQVVSLNNLADLRTGEFTSLQPIPPTEINDASFRCGFGDFGNLHAGFGTAKRACQIAVAGKLPLLFVGDSFMANQVCTCIPSIVPDLDEQACRERDMIWSAADMRPDTVPFRAPHHSATAAGIIGGGKPILPGEVSLAHGGVLYLEDIAEVKPSILQMLRQPLQEKAVRITRADGTVEFPADFLLVASARPCACGNFGNPDAECTCSLQQVEKYRNRMAGPLEFPMSVELNGATRDGDQAFDNIDSETLRVGVERAWEYRAEREAVEGAPTDTRGILASCKFSDEDREAFEELAKVQLWSGQQIVSVAKVARTIADIDESESVKREHIAEAASFLPRR